MDHIDPVLESDDLTARLRALIGMEICRIVEDLETRGEWLAQLWSKHRDRGPFLDSVFTRWKTLTFQDLMLLPTEEVAYVEEFYRELDDFRLYLGFTQDMPATLREEYDAFLHRLAEKGAVAIDAIGGAPERPLIEFPEAEDERAASFLAHVPGTERQEPLIGESPEPSDADEALAEEGLSAEGPEPPTDSPFHEDEA